jgi:hypothetical protein
LSAVTPWVVALSVDYDVICDIVVLCCFSDDDDAYLMYITGDTAVSGGEVRCCIFAEILAEI